MFTSPYYPQGNAVVERNHRTIGNMIRATLGKRNVQDWSTLLPGIMLMKNEMSQESHGYSASQIMWGRGMQLPVDLMYPCEERKQESTNSYVRETSINLRNIHRVVAPFNKNSEKRQTNPNKERDYIMIYQQRMERDHKLSPKWRGPFQILKILNPFQVVYNDEGIEKISHIIYCKLYEASIREDIIQNSDTGAEKPRRKRGSLDTQLGKKKKL